MPAFDYQALDRRGRLKKGMLEGDSARQVRQQLRDQGLAPTKVSPASQSLSGESTASSFLGNLFEPSLSVS